MTCPPRPDDLVNRLEWLDERIAEISEMVKKWRAERNKATVELAEEYSIHVAAAQLGISRAAVQERIKRHQLRIEKGKPPGA